MISMLCRFDDAAVPQEKNQPGTRTMTCESLYNCLGITKFILMYEPPHDKTYKMACTPSEDSDQPGHPPSLISLRCPHEESLGLQLSIERTVKTLNRLSGCPG